MGAFLIESQGRLTCGFWGGVALALYPFMKTRTKSWGVALALYPFFENPHEMMVRCVSLIWFYENPHDKRV